MYTLGIHLGPSPYISIHMYSFHPCENTWYIHISAEPFAYLSPWKGTTDGDIYRNSSLPDIIYLYSRTDEANRELAFLDACTWHTHRLSQCTYTRRHLVTTADKERRSRKDESIRNLLRVEYYKGMSIMTRAFRCSLKVHLNHK